MGGAPVTTPGGVPNLPAGALTLDTMASKLQDTTAAAQRARAVARVPSIFTGSSGGDPASDLSPSGVITGLYSGFASVVASADPADIQGPDDLPALLLAFIESLPIVGEFVRLGEAIGGTYVGDDPVLNTIQDLFRPLRELLQLVAGAITSFPPSPEEITAGWNDFTGRVQDTIDGIFNGWANLGAMLDLNKAADDVLEAISGIFNVGLSAQSKITAAEARLRALESAGNTISDDFGGASSSSLGSNYTVRNQGSGAGSIGKDGSGNAVWVFSGNGNRTQYCRRNDAVLTTDAFLCNVVFATNPFPYLFDDAYTYLPARMNTASNTMVRLRLGYGTAVVQKVVSDAVTNLGAPVSIPVGIAGNTMQWQGGEAGGTNLGHHVVLLGSTPIINEVDSSPVTGSGYQSVGIGMETGNYLGVTQNLPAGLAYYSFSEVL